MYTIESIQKVPISIEEAWDFFQNPSNLATITPDGLGFDILSEVPKKMYPGLFINYKVSPLFRIKMNWTTEITYVDTPNYFVDEQRVGPYAIWHHEHHFKAIPGGVEMLDRVNYKVPLGLLGKIAHPFIVRPKLEEIFDYRFKKVEELFGTWQES